MNCRSIITVAISVILLVSASALLFMDDKHSAKDFCEKVSEGYIWHDNHGKIGFSHYHHALHTVTQHPAHMFYGDPVFSGPAIYE